MAARDGLCYRRRAARSLGARAAVWLLDYGAGNVRSVANAISKAGHAVRTVAAPADLAAADVLVFPGVGSFGSCVAKLQQQGFWEPLRAYIASGRPLMGVCLGMQLLFAGSDESPGVAGLGVIPSPITKIDNTHVSVPHIGWNGVHVLRAYAAFPLPEAQGQYYFVHSYCALPTEANADWVLLATDYGPTRFVSAVQRANVFATQFHPEKSGALGLALLKRFLDTAGAVAAVVPRALPAPPADARTRLTKRVIACLDVRTNDDGDVVVTKGDQYNVREAGAVRNLGKPVELAQRYFEEGADEITFLNITSFRSSPMRDAPMLEVLRRTSEQVFVPLTIGGGIRDVTDPDGTVHSAVEVASEYFRSGADKVSIGSDAVYAAEEWLASGGKKTGTSCIEQIAHVYGSQAVVISVDPKRMYVASRNATPHHVIETPDAGPNGETLCWYQCTVKGGREMRDVDVHQLVRACEDLGAGEILLNCIDKDGTNSGFDLALVRDVRAAVHIPVIASSGAGRAEHFSEVFEQTGAEAALAAGIFHRREVPIAAVKAHLRERGIDART